MVPRSPSGPRLALKRVMYHIYKFTIETIGFALFNFFVQNKKKFSLFPESRIVLLFHRGFFSWVAESMDISVPIISMIYPFRILFLRNECQSLFLPWAEALLPWQPFENWISIQTIHPLKGCHQIKSFLSFLV